jgi:hypothetical protein
MVSSSPLCLLLVNIIGLRIQTASVRIGSRKHGTAFDPVRFGAANVRAAAEQGAIHRGSRPEDRLALGRCGGKLQLHTKSQSCETGSHRPTLRNPPPVCAGRPTSHTRPERQAPKEKEGEGVAAASKRRFALLSLCEVPVTALPSQSSQRISQGSRSSEPELPGDRLRPPLMVEVEVG